MGIEDGNLPKAANDNQSIIKGQVAEYDGRYEVEPKKNFKDALDNFMNEDADFIAQYGRKTTLERACRMAISLDLSYSPIERPLVTRLEYLYSLFLESKKDNTLEVSIVLREIKRELEKFKEPDLTDVLQFPGKGRDPIKE